jgi:hypothetical protein
LWNFLDTPLPPLLPPRTLIGWPGQWRPRLLFAAYTRGVKWTRWVLSATDKKPKLKPHGHLRPEDRHAQNKSYNTRAWRPRDFHAPLIDRLVKVCHAARIRLRETIHTVHGKQHTQNRTQERREHIFRLTFF